MLPQTNLQLYRALIDRGADEKSLAAVRAGYDVARQLFAGAFRPSHKPFLCHLVGTAGALVGWGEPIEVIVAGLLHSAYLYGDFADGERRASPARRSWLRSAIGKEAEELVCAYTEAEWNQTVDDLVAAVRSEAALRRLTTVKLADMLDESSDCGPLYSPQKCLEFRLHEGTTQQHEVLRLVEACVGPAAAQQFVEAFAALDDFAPPSCLVNTDRSFHTQRTGVPELARSRLGRKVTRIRQQLFWLGAA